MESTKAKISATFAVYVAKLSLPEQAQIRKAEREYLERTASRNRSYEEAFQEALLGYRANDEQSWSVSSVLIEGRENAHYLASG